MELPTYSYFPGSSAAIFGSTVAVSLDISILIAVITVTKLSTFLHSGSIRPFSSYLEHCVAASPRSDAVLLCLQILTNKSS